MSPVSGRCSTRSSPRPERTTFADSSGTTSAASATTRPDAEVPGRSPETPLLRANRPHRDQPRRQPGSGRRPLAISSAGRLPGGRAVTLAEGFLDRAVSMRGSALMGNGWACSSVDLPPEQYVLPTGRVRDSTAFARDLGPGRRRTPPRDRTRTEATRADLAFRPDRRQVAVRVDESEGREDRAARVLIVDAETVGWFAH